MNQKLNKINKVMLHKAVTSLLFGYILDGYRVGSTQQLSLKYIGGLNPPSLALKLKLKLNFVESSGKMAD